MFENFNLNRNLFVQERKLINHLRQLIVHLSDFKICIRAQIQDYMNTKNVSKLYFNSRTSIIRAITSGTSSGVKIITTLVISCPEKFFNLVNRSKEDILLDIQSDLPTKQDYEGAVRAMIILHNTYTFDLSRMSTSLSSKPQAVFTNISYYDYFESKTVNFPARESLRQEDFLVFAEYAANNFNFYDTAIDYITQAFRSYDEAKPNHSFKYMIQLRKYIVRLHNKYFCLLYTSPSPRDATLSRMPSSA